MFCIVKKCHDKDSDMDYWHIKSLGNVVIAKVNSCERHAIAMCNAINVHEFLKYKRENHSYISLKDYLKIVTKKKKRKGR